MLDDSARLVKLLASQTPDEIGELMRISRALAETNFERFQEWTMPFTTANARPAILSFRGDVYLGLDAPANFNERDYLFAQSTLRILSGLYGVLRPLDLIQPYRLEMGTKLENDQGADLYKFWGDKITDKLITALDGSPGDRVLLNLASNEYFKSVKTRVLNSPVVTPKFLDEKAGNYKIIAMFAKRARGAMAGWVIKNRMRTVEDLKQFNEIGYAYDPAQSTEQVPVFTRAEADRP